MRIARVAKAIYENAKAKGFWSEHYNLSEKLMLIVSEIAEAQEADRKNHFTKLSASEINDLAAISDDEVFKASFEANIKNSFEDEMADTLIRVLDLCSHRGIDLEKHIELKMRYNALRPHKHGKKY